MFRFFMAGLILSSSTLSGAAELKTKEAAPLFKAQNQLGKEFDLSSRKGQWTVLYFYPKAGTPGCTKQACAFRDNIDKIHAQGAEVYGISADTVAEQAAFHKEHHLNFDLLADPDDHVVNMYGAKMMALKMAKRWTFIIDPQLKIRAIMKDVDPVIDSEKMASTLQNLKNEK